MTRIPLPDTLSEVARSALAAWPDPNDLPDYPEPDDLAGWRDVRDGVEAEMRPAGALLAQTLDVAVEDVDLGGMDDLCVVPAGHDPARTDLVYLHGGGYTLFTARSSLASAALAAAHTGRRVWSIDYPLAPEADADAIRAHVSRALGMREKLTGDSRFAAIGESAGASLWMAVCLDRHADGLVLPRAVVAMSPWSDLAERGDTYTTLSDAEMNYRYNGHLDRQARAYCPDTGRWRDPLVSPVYGDFSADFPPTLVQVGTREIFLSNAVRLVRCLRSGGAEARLDAYEGMTHAFQPFLGLHEAPESAMAYAEARNFLNRHAEPDGPIL